MERHPLGRLQPPGALGARGRRGRERGWAGGVLGDPAFVAAASQGVEDVRGRLEVFIQPPAQDRSAPLADLGRRTRLGYLLLPEGSGGGCGWRTRGGCGWRSFTRSASARWCWDCRPGCGYFLRTAGARGAPSASRARARWWTPAASPGGTTRWRRAARWRRPFATGSSRCPSARASTAGTWRASGESPVAPEQEPDLSP